MDIRREMKARINDSKTRTPKVTAQPAYTLAHKEVRKSIKKDKQAYLDNMAREAENAAGKNNMRALYDIIRKLSESVG